MECDQHNLRIVGSHFLKYLRRLRRADGRRSLCLCLQFEARGMVVRVFLFCLCGVSFVCVFVWVLFDSWLSLFLRLVVCVHVCLFVFRHLIIQFHALLSGCNNAINSGCGICFPESQCSNYKLINNKRRKLNTDNLFDDKINNLISFMNISFQFDKLSLLLQTGRVRPGHF